MPNYYLFVVVSIILIVTPGPDFALITKNTILYEKRGGRATTYWVVSGHILHATASVLGISAVIAKSIVLFEIVKYVGAVYLLYIGIKALLSKQKNDSENRDYTDATYQTSKRKSCFLQGLLSTTFNPKAIIFYITFLKLLTRIRMYYCNPLCFREFLSWLHCCGFYYVSLSLTAFVHGLENLRFNLSLKE